MYFYLLRILFLQFLPYLYLVIPVSQVFVGHVLQSVASAGRRRRLVFLVRWLNHACRLWVLAPRAVSASATHSARADRGLPRNLQPPHSMRPGTRPWAPAWVVCQHPGETVLPPQPPAQARVGTLLLWGQFSLWFKVEPTGNVAPWGPRFMCVGEELPTRPPALLEPQTSHASSPQKCLVLHSPGRRGVGAALWFTTVDRGFLTVSASVFLYF